MLGRFIDFSQKHDKGALLNIFEGFPFDAKRVYTIRGIRTHDVRGSHAHHHTSTVLVALFGSCTVTLDDGERGVETIELSQPTKGILIYPYVWHTMQNFADDTTLLAITDTVYDEKDYIRDYSEFLSLLPVEVN